MSQTVIIQTHGERLNEFKGKQKVTYNGQEIGILRDLKYLQDKAGFALQGTFEVTVPLYQDPDHNVSGTLVAEIDDSKQITGFKLVDRK